MSGSKRPEYLGEPTLAKVMRRPRWILALLLALAVAAGFAALAQWQAGFAVQSQAQEKVDTETPQPLVDVASATMGVTEDGAAVVVLAGGEFVPEDFVVVGKRINGGEEGAWVVGNLVTAGPNAEPGAHLAVAIGWAPTVAAAQDVADQLARDPELIDGSQLEGRYMPAEAPNIPAAHLDPQSLGAMTPAHLANIWQSADGPVYSGFLVMHEAAGTATPLATLGLEQIDSVAPLPVSAVNWLNVFYAIEWLVFAGFAVFFWYRLARDAWEKEHEMKNLLAEAAAAPGEDASSDGASGDEVSKAAGAQSPAAHLETER
ncbi:SURF1 family cytochrome oxidase biogenesis protein [Leucobacter salsicius]|uniref:SURF1 family cytochrome oxidase biogenesis protein n=1 Tax=Leucobacter salsicius TaxID=664638 RepID=UPI00034C309C|nr:SURF1 family cytochrome oxidase biogenesis protein [Leucobacter salsicius]